MRTGETPPGMDGVGMEVREACAGYVVEAGARVPKGYKQTEVGVIPEDWICPVIKEIAANVPNAIVGGPFGSDLVSKDYVGVGVPVIRGQNMGRRYVSGDFVFVSDSKAKQLQANTARPNDIIFTQRGTLGQVSVVPSCEFEKYVISQSQMKLTLNPRVAHPECIYQYFISLDGQKQVINSAIQTGVPHTNLGILRAYRVPISPSLAEQEAIAEALSDADALIESLEQLLAKKRQIKQGAMQELLTGKKRLPGFSGEWGVKRLGEVLTIAHGRSQHDVADRNGIYPILATGGQIGTANRFLYDKPSVLIGRKGTIDQPQFMDTPFWTVDTLFYSVIHESNNAKFLFYRFCLIDWKQHNEASGVPSLNARTIERIEISTPEQAEQTAIAVMLSDMDAELAALEAKLAKARQIKQGMMQELLTGRIRLV